MSDPVKMSALMAVVRRPVIPVLTIRNIADAVPLARALAKGGLDVIEVTLRTDAALEAIRRIAEELPDVLVGAGTLRGPRDVERSIEAGARYLVSPGTTAALAEAAAQAPVPFLPGAATPSEVMALADRGFGVQKFFPAEPSGGIAMLKALSGPLPDIRFCPTGGITPQNARAYLGLANVLCVGGTWVAPDDAVKANDFTRIESLAREATGLR